jgi:2-oxoisovalerate dehydrogenase E2 component (dihydrolipoyl transacylase)
MARFEFRLPDVGEGVAEAEITAWHVGVGDEVGEDQLLADVMTDKATVEMESPVRGRVVELGGAVGDQLPVGSVLVVLETEAEAPAGTEKREPAAEPMPAAEPAASKPPAALPPAAQPRAGHASASPAVRKRARDLGIDLHDVPSTGDRVRHADLDAFLLARGGGRVQSAPGAPVEEGDEQIKIVGLRRRIAAALQESKRRIPHFSYVEELDVTALESLRAKMNGDGKAHLTLLPFLITALCRAAAEFPQINATFDDEAGVVTRHAAVHMGVATQTEAGLVVPVVRHAQSRDLRDLAGEIARVTSAAREGESGSDELSGSTMTISSLGPLGGIVSTPVIKRPEVAIVAVNRIVERPAVIDGKIAIRKLMNLSSSFDHRVVDGWDAASFIQRVKALLEDPGQFGFSSENSTKN